MIQRAVAPRLSEVPRGLRATRRVYSAIGALLATLGPAHASGQIDATGGCSVAGPVLQGVTNWELSATVDPDTRSIDSDPLGRRVLTSPVFVENRNGIQIDCVEGTLRLKRVFEDGSGASISGGPSEVRVSSGKVLWIVFREWSPTGRGEDLRDNNQFEILTFMDCCGRALNRHQLVTVDKFGTSIELYRLSFVEPAYQNLFLDVR